MLPTLHAGRYTVRGTLGEGAQGVTLDAWDAQAGRAVAIKRFDVRGAKGWKDVELAEREARVLATLDHPNLPRYIEHFEEGGGLFLVMEKVEGETLETILRRGPLPEQEVWQFLACADHALTYLHGRSLPMVHRDIKPRNVVRRPDGKYVFVDFGAVSDRMRPKGGSTIVGTYGYMAPEQLQGRALPQTDVYAVGATAITALTATEPDQLPHRGLRIDVRGIFGAGRVSERLIVALERMLEPDPDQRAQSVPLDAAGWAPPPPPMLPVPPGLTVRGDDALVKLIRQAIWIVWAIGWIVVPVIAIKAGHEELVPIVMFTWLAANIVASLGKGAAIRWLVNEMRKPQPAAVQVSGPLYRVDSSNPQQVRVSATTPSMMPSEMSSPTEVSRGQLQLQVAPPAQRR